MDPVDVIWNGFWIVVGIVGTFSMVYAIVAVVKEWARREL